MPFDKKEYNKIYNKRPDVKKKKKINEWIRRGLLEDDPSSIYDKWLNATHCERCEVLLSTTNNNKRKCLDHCHITGKFRFILCFDCNIKDRQPTKYKT